MESAYPDRSLFPSGQLLPWYGNEIAQWFPVYPMGRCAVQTLSGIARRNSPASHFVTEYLRFPRFPTSGMPMRHEVPVSVLYDRCNFQGTVLVV